MQLLSRVTGLLLLAFALAASAQSTRNVDELMRKSGLWSQVGSLQAGLRANMTQVRAQSPKGGTGDMDDVSFELLVKAAEKAFAADRLRSMVAAELAGRVPVEDEKEVLAWLDSGIGRRMTKLEESRDAAGDPMARYQEAMKYIASAPPERVELAERFAAALQAGESEVDTLIGLTSAAVYGMSLVDPRIDESAVRKVKETFDAKRPELVGTMRKLSTAVYAYTYREVPVADVTRYAEFIDSPVGLRYHDATRVAMQAAISRAAIDLGRFIGESLKGEPKRS